jgi:hypothetical protein
MAGFEARKMAKTNWKRAAPRSLRNSMELCLDFAKEKQNLSVDRVADRMGLASRYTLYKWMENGRLPAILIRPFEHACGHCFVTQFIATSAHKLLVNIPSGKPVIDTDLLDLQTGFNEAVNVLAKFYKGQACAEEALGELTHHLEHVVNHRMRVEKSKAPELGLFDGGES